MKTAHGQDRMQKYEWCVSFFHSVTPCLIIYFPICLLRGQSPMHVLGHYGKENAAAIFELFLECMPEYPLDKPDNEGNTGTVGNVMINNNDNDDSS